MTSFDSTKTGLSGNAETLSFTQEPSGIVIEADTIRTVNDKASSIIQEALEKIVSAAKKAEPLSSTGQPFSILEEVQKAWSKYNRDES